MTTQAAATAASAPRRPSRAERWRQYSYPLGALLIGILAWELAVRLFGIKTYILPAPSVVALKLIEQSGTIFSYSLTTAWEIILGYLLSIVIGIPLGLMIYQSKLLERILYPFLVASQTVPKIAIAPLLVIWFGWGLAPKVIVAFLIAIFPIVIDTVVGLKNTRPEMFYLVRSMGATRTQTFFKISLPNALPNIFAGLKVAITLAVVGAVVGEFIAADRGLGYILVVANGYLDTPLMFAGIIALSAMGILFFSVIEFLERIIVPWRSGDHPGAQNVTL